MSFRKRRALNDAKEELSHIKSKTELMFVLAAVFLLVTGLLFLLPTEKKAPPGVSVWPPGTPLRIEARRDFNLKGGPLRDGNCLVVNGERLRSGGFGGSGSSSEEAYRNRPHECSKADHDIYVRYTDPDGNVFEARSDRRSSNADGAFRDTLPQNREASRFGKQSSDSSYARALVSAMHRFEEMTYAHRFLKPGTYNVNIHLDKGDPHLKEAVLASMFVVLFEGTPEEIVVFNDRVPLHTTDADSREQTVVTFKIDEKGKLIEGSIDLETQVVIAEQ